MTMPKSLAPFDHEGKPATSTGDNIGLVLVGEVLAGRDKRRALERLRESRQITQAQYDFFAEKLS